MSSIYIYINGMCYNENRLWDYQDEMANQTLIECMTSTNQNKPNYKDYNQGFI